MKNPVNIRLIRGIWLLAIVAVIVGSLLPSNSAVIRTLDRLPITDKMEHIGMYALLAFLPAIYERRRVVILAAAGAVALGVGMEYAQLLTGWRDFEIGDMVADTVGAILGLASGLAVRKVCQSRTFRGLSDAAVRVQSKIAEPVPTEPARLPGGRA